MRTFLYTVIFNTQNNPINRSYLLPLGIVNGKAATGAMLALVMSSD
jgi:hypothetical protein